MPAVKQLDTGSQQPTLKSGILSEYFAQPKIPSGEQNKLSSWPISGDRGESLAALLCDSPRFMVFITSAQYCDLRLSQDSGRRYLCILRTIASVDTFNVEVATINQQLLAYSLLNAAQRPDIYYSVVLLRLSVSLGSAVAHAGPQNWLPPLSMCMYFRPTEEWSHWMSQLVDINKASPCLKASQVLPSLNTNSDIPASHSIHRPETQRCAIQR